MRVANFTLLDIKVLFLENHGAYGLSAGKSTTIIITKNGNQAGDLVDLAPLNLYALLPIPKVKIVQSRCLKSYFSRFEKLYNYTTVVSFR